MSSWNRGLNLSIFGESHGPAIGAVLDRLPAGEPIDQQKLQAFMDRRAPNAKKSGSTARTESDQAEILSGLFEGKTTGTPLCGIIRNQNTRSQDYAALQDLPRPGHADYTGWVRYQGFNDPRGGGHFSGRLTAPLVFAGGICQQILERRNIFVFAHIAAIHQVKDRAFDPMHPDQAALLAMRDKTFPVLDDEKGLEMQQQIRQASAAMDSVGGIVECLVTGMPAGVGSPMFGGLENDLASMIFAIPAVRGLEFGSGFAAAGMLGSEHNDAFVWQNGEVKTASNHAGGILGGISTSMPIVFRVAIKPTPSIAKEQQTVNLRQKSVHLLSVHGRHDACIVPRAVPVVEAAANLVVLSQLLECNR